MTIMAVLGAPIALAALWILIRNGVACTESAWTTPPRAFGHKKRSRRSRPRTPPRPPAPARTVAPDPKVELVKACEAALACWEDWAAGESGLNLQAIFAMRDVPAQLRSTLAKVKNATPSGALPKGSAVSSSNEEAPTLASPAVC